MLRPSSFLAASAAAAAALLCLCGGSGALAQATNPPLNGDFLITQTPILTPWQNGVTANSGSSTSIGATASRIVLGPCVYRTAHWHNLAWEVQTPLTPGVRRHFFGFLIFFVFCAKPGNKKKLKTKKKTKTKIFQLSLTSVMAQPSSAGGLSRTDIVAPGESIAYPAGWLHLQLNDNCEPIDTVLVFNAVGSGGTSNVPQALSTFDAAYTQVAWVTPLPAPQPTNWVVDPTCAARCLGRSSSWTAQLG